MGDRKKKRLLRPCSAGCGRQVRYDSRRSGVCKDCRYTAAPVHSPAAGSSRPVDSFAMDGTRAEIAKTVHDRVRTLEQLIAVCEIDTSEWRVERWDCNKWEMGMRGPGGEVVITELYQVKAHLQRKVEIIAARSEVADLIAQAKLAIPARRAPRFKSSPGYCLEIAIPDLHIGKLCWAPETGHANYDTKIAAALFEEAVEDLLQKTAHFGAFERIVFPVGNDLLNADNLQGTTTAGTPQNCDSRFQKTFSAARKMLIDSIELLRRIAPVDVIIVPGNHDDLSSWHMGDSLECFFHATPSVTIDNSPTKRKYYRFGSNMILFTHGDKGKPSDYPMVMATERPEMFGATRHREVHYGHKHQTIVQEFHGVRVRCISALCPPDAWHSDNQYVGQERSAEAFVWDRERGLVDISFFTVQGSETDGSVYVPVGVESSSRLR